jgi:4-amino-4-deoxy-L-arabinose transferase-like glycosyltransferase
VLWVLAGFLALLGLHAGTAAIPDVFDELSGQYAATAWEMSQSRDWIVPTLEGVPRLQKPPLVYWLTAASLAAMGHGETGARLPTALAVVALAVVVCAMGRRLYGPERGIAAAAIFASLLGTVLLGKLIMPEPFLALGISLALLAAVRAAEGGPARGRWVMAAWAAAALASLTKGLHGLLLPAAALVVVALGSRRARAPLGALLSARGVALFLAILLPWYVAVEVRFPGFLLDHLLNEQVGHVLDTHFPRDSEPTPVLLFWLQHLAWWFPWALFVPAALLARSGRSAHPLRLLPSAWLLTTAVAVTLAGQRQDYYSMSAWPAFALLASRAWEPSAGRAARAARVAGLAVLLGLAVAGLAAHGLLAGAPPGPAPAAPFGERNSMAGALSGLPPGEWRRLARLLWLAAGGLGLGAAGGLVLAWARRGERAWVAIAAGMLGPLVAAILGLQALAPWFGQKAIARALEQEDTAGALVVHDGPSHRASSLAFYASAPVRWLAPPVTEFAVRARGQGRDRFVTEDEVVRRWRGGARVWLVTEEDRLDAWRARLGAAPRVVARSGTRVLLASEAALAGRPRLLLRPAGRQD